MKPWIITCGLDCGVHKLVGDILQGHKYNETVLLGITNWDIVNGRESLATNDEKTAIKYPVVHPIDKKMVQEKSQANEIHLNKDHSYFLLVDSPKGHEHKGSEFRSQLENKLVTVHQGDLSLSFCLVIIIIIIIISSSSSSSSSSSRLNRSRDHGIHYLPLDILVPHYCIHVFFT